MALVSLDNVQFMIIDYVERRGGVVMMDGRQQFSPLDNVPPAREIIAKSIFDPQRWWMAHMTIKNDLVIAEMYSPVPADPLRGRPTIYLDQMHWRTLANRRLGTDARPNEVGPADDLLARASDGQVILPLSAGTISETTRLYEDLRYDVGITVARLSAGWQMQHALRVRADELTQALAKQFGMEVEPMSPVITLEPRATMLGGAGPAGTNMDYLTVCMTWSGTVVHFLTHPDQISSDRSIGEAWARTQQAYTVNLAADGDLTSEQRRRAAFGLGLRDLTGEMATAASKLGLTGDAISKIDMGQLVTDCPSILLYANWAMRRHMTGATWLFNDLYDMTYLSCAAAYANYVVTERQATGLLRQSLAAIGKPQTVYRTLGELMADLERDHGAHVMTQASTPSEGSQTTAETYLRDDARP